MNLTMNRLPVRTWNRLKMNESHLDTEGDFRSYTPEVLSDFGQGIRWETKAQWSKSVPGLSPDVTELVKEAEPALAEASSGQKTTLPIVLRYAYEKDEKAVSRLILHAEKDSVLSVILLLTSPDDSCDFSALQIQVHAEENAAVKLYIAQLMGSSSVALSELGGTAAENASVELVRVELGGAKVYTGVCLDLAGRQSRFRADVGYHVKPNHLLDMNYAVLHHGAQTLSDMEVSGTVEDKAQKIFRGTIDFHRGCRGAKGSEAENVLLMSEELINQTIPLILCKEEDVEGNHGATIGQLDEKVLFYLGSRGLDRNTAQRIIAQARIDAVCAKIPDEHVRDLVHRFAGQEDHTNE